MSISYEEQALGLLTSLELRGHPHNLTAGELLQTRRHFRLLLIVDIPDLEQALHVSLDGYSYRLFIFAFGGDYWSESPCTSLEQYVSQIIQLFQVSFSL